jgi:hypothetical protein
VFRKLPATPLRTAEATYIVAKRCADHVFSKRKPTPPRRPHHRVAPSQGYRSVSSAMAQYLRQDNAWPRRSPLIRPLFTASNTLLLSIARICIQLSALSFMRTCAEVSTQATGRAFAGHPAMPRPLWSSSQAAERRRWLPASVPENRQRQRPPVVAK